MATHKEKEQEKLKLLYDIYEQPMYRIAYAILHHTEQAEDAVSDAFLRILKNLKKIGDVRSEKTKHYIISIIRSTAINQYRQNQRDSERYTVWDDRILQVPNQKDDMEQLLANIAQEESIAESPVQQNLPPSVPWIRKSRRRPWTHRTARHRWHRTPSGSPDRRQFWR